MIYRREIDGLRAIAVLPVLFFHAGFELFSGGFVGVDVFFVISGYLITSIIIKEQREERFTLLNFYERRARRILPALFLVLISCMPFAWLWMAPEQLRDFGQSLIATPLFLSNVLFGSEVGYFAAPVELKPLLHTWSLSVEEQYYALFPLFILMTWRLGQVWIISILALIFFSSLALAQWAASHYPAENFYLLPTRLWELLIGVFAAFYLANKNTVRKIDHWKDELFSAFGATMVLYAIFSFDRFKYIDIII